MSAMTSDTLINPQELFDLTQTTNDGIQVGALATTGDGRYYRWSVAGAVALVAGQLQQAPVQTTAHANLAIAAAALGATSVTTTSAITVTANQYAGGFLVVTRTPGLGYIYQIGSHAAATAAVVTLNLVDPIQVALTTASTISLVNNTYNGVIVNPTTATANIAGVAVAATPALGFGWLQTKGIANVLAQGTIVVGSLVAASATTAGAIVATSGVLAPVGVAANSIATTDYGAIALNIS